MVFSVYTSHATNRLKYILDLVLIQLLGIDAYELHADPKSFRASSLPKINYSRQRIDNREFFIPSGGLLAETHHIQKQHIEVKYDNGLPYIFPQTSDKAHLPFDLPAMVFYLVSRYEEYLDFTGDHYDRFPAAASIAHQHGFLHRPLVNEWAIRLGDLLTRHFTGLKIKTGSYRFCPTYDIDMAWAYKNKGFLRSSAGLAKDLLIGKPGKVWDRILVHAGRKTDPFFTFDYLDRLNREEALEPVYFFLAGDYGEFDKNISVKNRAFRELIAKTSSKYPIGIHPSYRSSLQARLIRTEMERLQIIAKKEIIRSRQHFLKLRFPQTYRRLLAAGIREDFTMGYASLPGFRASIATPFYWYDLRSEQPTSLLIHPFQLMDVTLKEYLKLPPENALEVIRPLVNITRRVGGHFCTIWHNSSFAPIEGWRGWQQAYEAMIHLAK